MKQYYAADLRNQTEVTEFFMVKSAGIKVGANKKQYFDVLLGDKTGEVNSKKWDIAESEIEKATLSKSEPKSRTGRDRPSFESAESACATPMISWIFQTLSKLHPKNQRICTTLSIRLQTR